MVAPAPQSPDPLATVRGVYPLKADADRHTDQAHLNSTPNQYYPLRPAYRSLCVRKEKGKKTITIIY